MVGADVMRRVEEIPPYFPISDFMKGEEQARSRGMLLEKKIEYLERIGISGKVGSRRSRRWLNDFLLIELVPRLNAEEIRGLFAPPPFGDFPPKSPFSMTCGQEWDSFRNVDMDTEARLLESMGSSLSKRKDYLDKDKTIALNAWHRIGCRTREAIRHNFLSDLVQRFEDCIKTFIMDSEKGDVLDLHVQDAYHRLLLHGVCEFYDLTSVTITSSEDGRSKTKTTRIKKKKSGVEIPQNVTLSGFVKMAKEGGSILP
ncbi:hypothetical protein ZOSMA_44G01370 [Zostera marina]|uniref:R3H-associated N-terminal domain-containing protein n=1 Tax=Zostera marina TaxID=29655 RepID=A0A0K9P181_ZOSMR|nr:hypothetical protein ZOSMA_44G01370 [Zostera marina]